MDQWWANKQASKQSKQAGRQSKQARRRRRRRSVAKPPRSASCKRATLDRRFKQRRLATARAHVHTHLHTHASARASRDAKTTMYLSRVLCLTRAHMRRGDASRGLPAARSVDLASRDDDAIEEARHTYTSKHTYVCAPRAVRVERSVLENVTECGIVLYLLLLLLVSKARTRGRCRVDAAVWLLLSFRRLGERDRESGSRGKKNAGVLVSDHQTTLKSGSKSPSRTAWRAREKIGPRQTHLDVGTCSELPRSLPILLPTLRLAGAAETREEQATRASDALDLSLGSRRADSIRSDVIKSSR